MTLNTYPPNPSPGREVANVTFTVDTGPTGVVLSPASSIFVDLGTLLVRAVAHEFEVSCAIGSSAPGAVQFELWEGTPAAPTVKVGAIPVWTDGARPAMLDGRLRFAPAAGSRPYHVRWSNLASGSVNYTLYSGSNYNANMSMREIPQ